MHRQPDPRATTGDGRDTGTAPRPPGRVHDRGRELCRRAEVAEAEREEARLRLAEVSGPAVVVVAGQDVTEAVHATETTPDAHGPVQGLWGWLRRAWRKG